MNAKQLQQADVEALLGFYEEAAHEHGRAMEKWDHKKANPMADILTAVHRELKNRGSEGQTALLKLLDHPDAHVRLSAAGDALEFAADRAEPVLKALSTSEVTSVRITAATILREWHKGTLYFQIKQD